MPITYKDLPHIARLLIREGKLFVSGNKRAVNEMLSQKLNTARLFAFDFAATQRATEIGQQNPDLLAGALPFLRLPHNPMVLAYPADALPPAVLAPLPDADARLPIKLNLLEQVAGKIICTPYILMPTRPNNIQNFTAVLVPGYSYHLHFDHSAQAAHSTAALTHMLGSAFAKSNPHTLNTFAQHLDMTTAKHCSITNEHAKIIAETDGDFRNTLAMLMLLNSRGSAIYNTAQPRKINYQARRAPYMVETTVTIALPKQIIIRALEKELLLFHISRRRHEVIGHWRHYNLSEHCTHNFAVIDDDHLKCATCKGIASWVHPHERGDAALGYVKHSRYQIVRRYPAVKPLKEHVHNARS